MINGLKETGDNPRSYTESLRIKKEEKNEIEVMRKLLIGLLKYRKM